MKTSLQVPGLTSLPSTLTAKKSLKMKFFCRQDVLQFFSGELKDYKYVNFPQTLEALLKFILRQF